MSALPRLRPEPWPVTPLGPYRLAKPNSKTLIKFPTLGDRVIRWIEKHGVFTDGKWVGKPFRLQPWQKQLILDMFETVYDPELGRQRLRYRTFLIGIPKKQGKTELMGAIACWIVFGSGMPSPGVAVAASSDEQAQLVFKAGSFMVENSPTLREHAEVWDKEVTANGIPNGRIIRVAAAGGKLDGKKLLASIYDELHEWQSKNQRKVFGMLRGALALADEPLNIMITTAGEDDGEQDEDSGAPWLRMYRSGRMVESGEIDDPTMFFRWWMAPLGCDHRDIAMTEACNPNYGITVQEAFYRDELSKRTESEYRRYYLNQPVESVNIWLEHGTWEACQVEKFELDPHAETYIGWDASTKRDSTAVTALQVVDGRWRVKLKAWERPVGPDGEAVRDWKVPRNEVLEYVRTLYRTLNVVAGQYDPHAIAWVAEDLENEGLALYECAQTDAYMCPATQALYEAIIDQVLAHDGDPILTRHIKAAKVKNTPRGGQRLVKAERGRKIDGAISTVIAIGAMRAPKAEEPIMPSVWVPNAGTAMAGRK